MNAMLSVVPETVLGAGEGIAIVAGGDLQVPQVCGHGSCTRMYQPSTAIHAVSLLGLAVLVYAV